MPIYTYECQSCRYVFEVEQSMSDTPIKKCIKCGKAVKKIIPQNTNLGILFKGNGFYSTDNPKK